MNHQEGFIKNQGNQSVYYQSWLPESEVKAILLIIHGLNEHSGRYTHFADFFAAQGFAVYSMDLIGHGKSAGTRAFISDISLYLDDFILYLEKIRDWQPGKRIFLVGHSLGGLLGTLLLIDHQDQFAGAVLSGSVVQVPDDISPLIINLGKVLSAILPKMGLLQLDLDGLSRDPAVVQAYQADPLVNSGKFTARVSAEMNKGIDRVAAEGSRINQPVLILHGSADRIVSPSDSRFLYELVSSEQKQLIIYEDFYHEIYNDPEHEQVYQDVLAWLQTQLG
jgi:alpha-beta hydrolase superfamily lysophospholipase